MYFRCYRLSKTWLDQSLESTFSELLLTVNMLKYPKHLWNLYQNTFIIFFHHSGGEMIWKVSPLVKSEISGVFVNTLAADHKYPVLVCENMPLPIQTILS